MGRFHRSSCQKKNKQIKNKRHKSLFGTRHSRDSDGDWLHKHQGVACVEILP